MGPGESARVSVAVRVRPLAAKERLAGSDSSIFVHEDGSTLTANPGRSFVFDRVCGEDTPQAELHTELVKPMISRCIDGYNCTVLAYGQTGSGKTHTMTGTMVETDNPFVDDLGGQEGTIPRTVVQLMSNLELVYSNIIKFNSDAFHEVYVSFIELYQEEIVDLLNPSQTRTRGGLAIREDGLGGVCVAGATEERVQNASDILELLRKGTLCRTTKSTDMNLASSRSHAIFTLMIRQRRPASFSYEKFCSDNNPMFDHEINSPHSKGCENVPGNTESQLPSNCDDNNSSFSSSEVLKSITSKLHFVDLAGSERLKRTNAIGVRAKESISINSGLLALGNVISALASMEDDLVRHGRKPHVPYRDSKLTRLLQDSLGGNSHTLMIACVSPASEDIPETVNTLRYASRARAIKNHAAVNEDAGGVAAFEVLQLRRQVAALRQELLQIRGMGRRITCPPQSSVPGTPRQIGASLQHQEASDAELIRLRASNRELTRRVESLTREKISIEAERDYFKSNPAPNLKRANSEIPVIKQHLSTIQELKARVTDLELRLVDRPLSGTSHGVSSFTSNVITGGHLKAPKEPGTPAWIAKATAAIEKTRSEIQASVPLAAEAQRLQAQGAEPSKVASLLTRVISDVSVKEDLIVQLETAQREALFMRQKYDERHTLALERLSAATLERDEALALVATLRSSKSTSKFILTSSSIFLSILPTFIPTFIPTFMALYQPFSLPSH